MGLISCSLGKQSNNVFYGFLSVKCGTSGILPVSRREQNEVDDFSKSTSRLKSMNRDSSNSTILLPRVTVFHHFREYDNACARFPLSVNNADYVHTRSFPPNVNYADYINYVVGTLQNGGRRNSGEKNC